MKTRHVAVDREELAELRRLAEELDLVVATAGPARELVDRLRSMEVLKMESALAIEIETGTMTLRAKEEKHRYGVRTSKSDR